MAAVPKNVGFEIFRPQKVQNTRWLKQGTRKFGSFIRSPESSGALKQLCEELYTELARS